MEEVENVEVEEVESDEEVTQEKDITTEETETEETEESDETGEEEGAADQEETEEQKKEKALLAKAQDEKRKRQEAEKRIEALEKRFQEAEERSKSPQPLDEQRLNDYFGELRDEIDTLRLSGKHLEAEQKELQRDKLINEYIKYKEDLAKHQTTQTTAQQHQQKAQQLAQQIDSAAEFYAQENKIPKEVFMKMGQKWQEVVQTDQLRARKFWETAHYQGPVAAIEYAHREVKSIMEQESTEVESTKQKKESGKEKQVGGGAKTNVKSAGSWDDLMKKPTSEIVAFKKSNPAAYQKLLDKAMK